MKLSSSLVLTAENNAEKQKLDMVLSIVRNTLALTSNMPTLTWKEIELGDEQAIFISAPDAAMNIVKLNLQVLGVNFNRTSFEVEYHQPIVTPSQTNEVATNVAHYSVIGTIHNDSGGIRFEPTDTPSVVGVDTSSTDSVPVIEETRPTVVTNHISHDEGDDPNQDLSDNCYAQTREFGINDEIPFDLAASRQDRDTHINGITLRNLDADAAGLNLVNGEPDMQTRTALAAEDRSLVATWHSVPNMPEGERLAWELHYLRLTETAHPTESASGTITMRQQVEYDFDENPRRWNLVKCTFGDSSFKLTYLCPPCVDLYTTLRILGGRHASDVPHIEEVCVWNTEPYWRELRHLMHNPDVHYIREAIVA